MQCAIGYIRVSTPSQAENGISLDAQEGRIRAWCDANNRRLVEPIYADKGISGSRSDNRPALQHALDRACETSGVLVVYSLSRLARSTYDTIEIAERLEKAGADLVSLSENLDTTTAAGKMIFRLLAVLAEFERDLISERTKGALAYKRSKGEMTGCVRYGYKGVPSERTTKRGTQIILEVSDKDEQDTIRQMKEWWEAGASYRGVARVLNADGIPTRNGGKWRAATVRKILLREKGDA